MKEFSVEVRVRNNRIRRRRMELGISQYRLADESGVHYSYINGFENMRKSPLRKDGINWRASAIKLSEFFMVDIEELFPDAVLQISRNRIERELSAAEAFALTGGLQRPELPDKSITSRETKNILTELLEKLRVRDRYVIEQRYGLTGDEPKMLREIAEHLGRSKEVVRQNEARGLKHLRKLMEEAGLENSLCP